MSVLRLVQIDCDGCMEPLVDAIDSATVADLRAGLQADGAHVRLPGGRDLCAECWKDGWRVGRDGLVVTP